MPLDPFILRWQSSAAAERANYALFLSELCDFLAVPRPEPTTDDARRNNYVFERSVTLRRPNGTTSTGFIDLYKRGTFILEAKQGATASSEDAPLLFSPIRRVGIGVRKSSGWDTSMLRARNQAEQYARSLPIDEPCPPFLIVTDVGYSFEIYADFSGTGRAYVPFPDSPTSRILLEDSELKANRELLRAIWLDPHSLDPSRISARVTVEVATQLANLARDLERTYAPDRVSAFLMRCIFTFFAEDIHLLPAESFTNLLKSLQRDLPNFKPMVESLWQTMNSGGFSPILREHVLQFNGGLFESVEALPLNGRQLDLLLLAAVQQWRDVEPAIFGTLLERALDSRERHRLGAHYTPRAYVERLVLPTVIEPLRRDWADAQAAAATLERAAKTNEAIETLRDFRQQLCNTEILDPACGSGNFLYVTLEHLKRLEGEVNLALESLGETQQAIHETGLTVDPHQLKGIELNPRAAAITDLVLWIGYLQWYFRTWGASTTPPQPVIKRFHNIESRDALLAYDSIEPALDAKGQPVTQWDGITKKEHPVTGEEVPDESARRTVMKYINPRRAPWPSAQFIVGNPPFLGNWILRGALGDGYTETLRDIYNEVPESADYVMYWWHRAAQILRKTEGTAPNLGIKRTGSPEATLKADSVVREQARPRAVPEQTSAMPTFAPSPAADAPTPLRRFGFITTNSIRQTFQRRVLVPHLTDPKNPISLVFAIPDHPWVDSSDGADVRIAMTVAEAGSREGVLWRVATEQLPGEGEGTAKVAFEERTGIIHPDLSIGPNTTMAVPLRANEGLSCPGVKLHGAGFIVTPDQARDLGLSRIPGIEQHIREYRNGRDLTAHPRGVMVIDFFGLTAEQARERFPEAYQWVFNHVKPERDQNSRPSYRENWWIHGEPRRDFRPALSGLNRYIATVETAKHRFFVFLDASILPDNMLVNIASSDAYILGILSSRIHVTWALAAGGTLEDRPRYNKTRCFEPFPFPDNAPGTGFSVPSFTPAEASASLQGERAEWPVPSTKRPQLSTSNSAAGSVSDRIRFLAEQLDAHRKRQQQRHPTLTLTGMYNVLEQLRSGEALDETAQKIHDDGLVSVLRDIQADLDKAVFEAYGWQPTLTSEEILFNLVALNATRAAEERTGLIRWLRPEFQKSATTQTGLEIEAEAETIVAKPPAKQPWPEALPERVRAVRDALMDMPAQADPNTVARRFTKARVPDVTAILETLVALGQAHREGKAYRY